jgi:hypothetical protein
LCCTLLLLLLQHLLLQHLLLQHLLLLLRVRFRIARRRSPLRPRHQRLR